MNDASFFKFSPGGKCAVGSCLALGEFGPGAVVTEDYLAHLFGQPLARVRLAIACGELPRPIALMGRTVWTVDALVTHLETRLHGEAAYSPGVPTLYSFTGVDR